MKKNILFSVLLACVLGITVACNTESSDSSSDKNEVEVTTAAPAPTLTEDEACSRARNAVQDKFALERPSLSGSDEFVKWGDVHGGKATYNENSDSYKVEFLDESIGMRFSFMGVELFAGYDVTFDATVTVYSNGDAHVDSFNYDVVCTK